VLKLKVIRDLKSLFRVMLPPGEHKWVSVYARSPNGEHSKRIQKRIPVETKI